MEVEPWPVGFRFCPRDDEIMDYYLKFKMIDHGFRVDSYLPELDVLGSEPWEIFNSLCPDPKDKECYFISPHKRKYPNSSRAKRTTRGGYWKSTGKRPEIMTLGTKRKLVYHEGRFPKGKKTNWVIDEYARNDLKGFVLCRLKKKKDKSKSHQEESRSSGNFSSTTIEDHLAREDANSEVQSQQEANQEIDTNATVEDDMGKEFDQLIADYQTRHLCNHTR